MVLYWNECAELFTTRNLKTGDSYEAVYLPFSAGDAVTEQRIRAAGTVTDTHYMEVASRYLSVPEHMQR